MRKKSKKQQDKARRQQQRETIKNLHRQLNDVRIQLNQYQGMHAAHLDELSRVANTKEQEVTEKYQPQVAKLKSQLADNEAKHNKEMTELTAKHKADLDQLQGKINAKDAILSKEVAESQEAKRQAQSLQQQMTEQSQKLAAITARDAAHGEELERVKKETAERTAADYQKQLDNINAKLVKAQEAENAFKERMAKGQELAGELKESMAPGRPKKGVRPLNLSISAVTMDKYQLLKKVKLITFGEVSKAVDDFLESWMEPKMAAFEEMTTSDIL